jgi:SpoVK/Ycf46/Vps4 family AAA+-type ATPase
MSTSKYRICRSGKQSFPTPDHSNLPVNALVARYTLNLLPHSPWHSEFLELLYAYAGVSGVAGTVADTFAKVLPKVESDRIRKVDDPDELNGIILHVIERHSSSRLDALFRSSLANGLKLRLPSLPRDGQYQCRAVCLRKMLGLSNEDIAVIECFACYEARGLFENYCDQYPYSDWVSLVSTALNMPKAEVRKRVEKGGSLASKGLVEMRNNSLGVNDAVFEYLAGLSNDFLSNNEFSLMKGSSFPLDSFPITEKERTVLADSLRNPAPCHLFFYGRPGTGKTELARALAADAGRQAFLVKYGEDGDERNRRGAITATLNVAPSDAVVIIDEADRLLNTATLFQQKLVDKGWINNFMDECRHKVIWIANETGSIETSVLRRFSYSLEFKKFTTAQRISAWNVQLKNHPLRNVLCPAMVEKLARSYEVDAGGIASTLKAAENIFTGHKPETQEAEQTLGQLLGHHEKLSGIERKKKKLNQLSPNYDVKALHTDFRAMDLIAALKVRESDSTGGRQHLPANIMFWGLPGTGKTEFGKYIAQELGRELLVKRMSDLQSMYVGQTEKQIAAAFDEADRDGAVLFLDEADSLILDRKTASRSWESSQTNEVLTQMENFSGICICCTNLLDGLDEAALRRFTWKIKFLPLTPEGAVSLFRKYFQPTGRLSAAVKGALRGIQNLTPGDFKTVWQRHQYGECKSSATELIQALKQEVSYKRPGRSAIGFAV